MPRASAARASGTPARKRRRATRMRSTWSRFWRTELSTTHRTNSSRRIGLQDLDGVQFHVHAEPRCPFLARMMQAATRRCPLTRTLRDPSGRTRRAPAGPRAGRWEAGPRGPPPAGASGPGGRTSRHPGRAGRAGHAARPAQGAPSASPVIVLLVHTPVLPCACDLTDFMVHTGQTHGVHQPPVWWPCSVRSGGHWLTDPDPHVIRPRRGRLRGFISGGCGKIALPCRGTGRTALTEHFGCEIHPSWG